MDDLIHILVWYISLKDSGLPFDGIFNHVGVQLFLFFELGDDIVGLSCDVHARQQTTFIAIADFLLWLLVNILDQLIQFRQDFIAFLS